GLRKSEPYLASECREVANGEPGKAVLFLDTDWDPFHRGPCQRCAGCVPTGAHQCRRPFLPGDPIDLSPGAHETASSFLVLPGTRPVERIQVQQPALEFRLRQNFPLDSALSANEVRAHAPVQLHRRARDGKRRVQMSPCAAPGEEDPHSSGRMYW